jgi:phosphate uptake regulator
MIGRLVPIAREALMLIFEALDQKDIADILRRTREVDEFAYQALKEIAREVGKESE